jgi:anti-anti-sigma factor
MGTETETRMAEEAVRSLLIAELPGEIDVTNCDAAAAGLLAAVSAPGVVIADMTGTEYCDSSGMRMLLTVHDRAHASGSALRIAVRPGTGVARMMGLLGLYRVLSVYESVEAALPPGCAAETAVCVHRARMPELCRTSRCRTPRRSS